jgi:hypothetical protein
MFSKLNLFRSLLLEFEQGKGSKFKVELPLAATYF